MRDTFLIKIKNKTMGHNVNCEIFRLQISDINCIMVINVKVDYM